MEIVRNSDGTLVVPVQLGRQHETDNESDIRSAGAEGEGTGSPGIMGTTGMM